MTGRGTDLKKSFFKNLVFEVVGRNKNCISSIGVCLCAIPATEPFISTMSESLITTSLVGENRFACTDASIVSLAETDQHNRRDEDETSVEEDSVTALVHIKKGRGNYRCSICNQIKIGHKCTGIWLLPPSPYAPPYTHVLIVQNMWRNYSTDSIHFDENVLPF